MYAFSEDTIYVYFQGTNLYDRNDLWTDISVAGVDFEGMKIGNVFKGYYDRSLKADLNSIYKRARNENKQIIISGHSLGGGCATISTMMLLNRNDYNYTTSDNNINIMCVTYGSVPCVDENIRKHFYSLGYKDRFLNIFFKYDIIYNLMHPYQCLLGDENERLEEDPENAESFIEFYLKRLIVYITTPVSNVIKNYVCSYCHIGNHYNVLFTFILFIFIFNR